MADSEAAGSDGQLGSPCRDAVLCLMQLSCLDDLSLVVHIQHNSIWSQLVDTVDCG